MIKYILNNSLIPLKRPKLKFRHVLIYFTILLVIIVQLVFQQKETHSKELFIAAKQNLKNIGLNPKLSNTQFNKRSNNLWVNLIYYEQYKLALDKYFKGNKPSIPKPKYPVISFWIKDITGYHIFAPTNLVEIVSFLRKNLGSGITIRTESKILSTKTINTSSKPHMTKLISNYKEHIKNRFKIVIEGYESPKKKRRGRRKKIKKVFVVSFSTIPNIANNIKSYILESKLHQVKLRLFENEDSVKFFSDTKNDTKDNLKYEKLKKEIKKDNKDKFSPKKQLLKPTLIYKTNIPRVFTKDYITLLLNQIQSKMARVYTLSFSLKHETLKYTKLFKIPFDEFPKTSNMLNTLFKEPDVKNVVLEELTLKESKILKHRPNSREYIDAQEIPKNIKKAYLLIEDDNFYVQGGGIDPIGLFKAAFGYIFSNERKGNASIIEQIYEMYLGKQSKTPFEKLIQILGAIYLDYYTKDRDKFLNLYVQSIPGSFFRDHNYGIKGIIRNYLNKNTLSSLTTKELGWLTRIGLSPNTFGQDYIRYHILKDEFSKIGIDITNDDEIISFLKERSKALEKEFKNKNRKRKPSKEIEQKEKNSRKKEIDSTLSLINRVQQAYKVTEARIGKALYEFKKGNESVRPLITEEEYSKARSKIINFKPSRIINEYQSYTDQTLKELTRYLGSWAVNANLDLEVEFHEKEQIILEEELAKSTKLVYNFRDDSNAEYKKYGGAAVLIKTHNIKDSKIANKIIAIASKHTSPKVYFNWAVHGHRHFGSIFKWIVLLLYLDKKGTLLDTYYDIPRSFEYVVEKENGKKVKGLYRPDNWRIDREYNYGHFTYKKHDNVYNFLQSKNNTFVKLADLVGLKNLSRFLNDVGDLNRAGISKHLKFKPIYPIALGSQDINSIRFAQINTIITNQGVLQPITTITRLIQSDNKELKIDFAKESKQVVSREAAEGALFCGYLNTYFGTAKRFIKGGAGKTGSSDTDVSFLATTLRTPDEYIEDEKDNLLNHNLLYLINIGVNEGKVDDGLFGGNVPALNAKEVFERLLGREYVGKGEEVELKYPIGGNITKYFSKKFFYKPVLKPRKLNNKNIYAPILRKTRIRTENTIDLEELLLIRSDYERHKDLELEEKTAIDFAKVDGEIFHELSPERQQEYRNIASVEVEKQKFEYQFKMYEKQLWNENMDNPNNDDKYEYIPNLIEPNKKESEQRVNVYGDDKENTTSSAKDTDKKTLEWGKNVRGERTEDSILQQLTGNEAILNELEEKEKEKKAKSTKNDINEEEESFLKNLIDETLNDR